MDNPAHTGLEHMAAVFQFSARKSIFHFFLECGEECPVKTLRMEQARYVARLVKACGGYDRFQPGQCWHNAQRLMMHDHERRLDYYEGYHTGEQLLNLPIHHGWCRLDGETVVDITARANLRQLHRRVQQYYWGVNIPYKMLFRHMAFGGEYCPLTEPLSEIVQTHFKWNPTTGTVRKRGTR